MRFLVLATDYDGTLAAGGRVDAETVTALRRVKCSGRRLVLVTGRRLDDLLAAFPEAGVFDRVVAENGGLLYRPATRGRRELAAPPDEQLIFLLRARGVAPLGVGEALIATTRPHQTAVLEAIRELGLELRVILNKGAVMVLPETVDKATGLTAALEELGVSAHRAVGVGDAENDLALLTVCGTGVAVGDAIESLRERADHVTAAENGAGVRELCAALVDDDLAELRAPA